MEFGLSDEQKLIQETARRICARDIKPYAVQLDETEDRAILLRNLKILAENGFMGMMVSEEYGGSHVGTMAYSLAMTEVGRACSATAVTMSVTNMVAEIIYKLGTDEQRRRYLLKLCKGEYPAGAFALTETMAGSDASGIRTTALPDGDEYVLNGSKIFISSAEYSGVFAVWAVTDRNLPPGKGITCFLLEADTPGLIVGKREEKMGQHGSSTNELRFENCRVPREAVLGNLNDGYRIAVSELAGGRIGVGSMALGMGYEAIDVAVAYARERIQFGKPISSFQAIQWMIAESHIELEAAKLLLLKASWMKDQGLYYGPSASMGKLYATEAANRVCYRALQILGGYGYTKDYPLERLARDVRVTTLYEGTSEMQRIIISRDILKE